MALGPVPGSPLPATPAYLSLGTNIGDRLAHLRAALAALPTLGLQPLRISRLYETAPVGFRASRWFLNCVVACATRLSPLRIVQRTQALERALGRRRLGPGWAPRIIDIDLVLYDRCRVATRALRLPHPAIGARRFLRLALRDLGALPPGPPPSLSLGRQPLRPLAASALAPPPARSSRAPVK